MKRPIVLVATFGLALIAADATSAQDYECPFGRGDSYVPASIDRSTECPDSYDLSECPNGACSYAQDLAEQSRSYPIQRQRTWDSQSSPHRIPAGDWRNDIRSQNYDLRSDDRRPKEYELRDSYSRNDFHNQPSTYRSQTRSEQRPSNDRPRTYDRGLTLGSPPTFDRSLTNSRTPMDDFQPHQHDGSCNHDHGRVKSTPPTFDRRPSQNPSPRYGPETGQRSPSRSRPLSDGPPPLPPPQ